MDKRRLMSKTSLHKNLSVDPSFERTASVSNNKQTFTTNVMMRKKNPFIDTKVESTVESKPLNSQSSITSTSSIGSRKRSFCETDNDISERDFTINYKLLKTETSKKLNSQISIGTTSIRSGQETVHLLKSNITNKHLMVSEPSVEKSVLRKGGIASSNPVEQASYSDLDLSYKENTIMKKKRSGTTVDRNIQHIAQDININNHNSSKKTLSLLHKSLVAPITKSNISPKKQQKKSKEPHSSAESENRALNNEELDKYRINNKKYCPRRQHFSTPSVFSNFLQECGITLSTNDIHVLHVLPSAAKRKMTKKLNLKQYQKRDLVGSIEKYIRNEETFEKMLNDMELSIENKDCALSNVSLARILLEVTEIQADIYNIFISRLNESVLLADIPEKVPWAVPLLHQFRFLDIVDSVDILTTNIEQLLETCPPWFQRELILFLPDILSDIQHQNIAQVLTKMLEENCDLTNVILNCIASFNLGKEYLEEYKVKVLHLLKTNMKVEFVPTVVRFLLNNCVCSDTVKQIIFVLRNIEIQPLVGDEVENCYKNQMQIVKALRMCILSAKDVTHAAITVVKDINKNPKPLDFIILLLIFSGTIKQKHAEALLKQNVRCGFYRISLLHTLYDDYKEVVRELQPSMLQLAGKLLKSEERVFINFAIELFRLQFLSWKETLFKQREIIEKIILLMGNNDQTVKHALTVLCKMSENTIERDCLVSHCNHLRILLEKIDYFGFEEVGIMSDLLHRLCLADDSASESLRDDLFILLQKQLSAAKPITKCKGVMGAVMAIKHLAGKTETCDRALKLFSKVMKSVKSCSKSQPLFYDQLAQVIAQTELINTDFLKKINDYIENELVDTYMIDKPQSSNDLVPKYGLNNTEDEPQNYVLNFGNKRSGPIAPILFRLLKICCMRLSAHGGLEEIDALLGCGMLMPQNFNIPEPPVLDFIIYAINWFREIITGFVAQMDPLLQEQVLKRLDTLIYLQGELNMLLMLCDSKYQPAPCYFHYFPLPPFVKIEKKTSKKGNKSTKGNKSNAYITVENESWEIGSTLCSKNPAYFRKFDAQIAHLLDVKIDLQSSQFRGKGISIKQVCFLVRELLAIFENEASESFVKDLIHLLPKICSKLDDVVTGLRRDNNHDIREGARLLLCLLTKIFNWKGFLSVTYNTLLREGLRSLAKRVNEENAQLRSCKELVAESYKYFDSLLDVATEISLATALVNMCESLMKHSETYTQQYKSKHAKLAYGFLCLEWPDDRHIGPRYKLSIIQLLNNWIDNEPSPLDTVTSILEWLPDEVSDFENIQSTLPRIPSINRSIFQLLYKKLFDGLIKGINVSLLAVNSDAKRIKVWRDIAFNVQKLVQICKTLKTKANIQLFLRYMPLLIKQFLNTGMPILEHNLKYQTDDVTGILKMMQSGTRYLHAICCDCTEKKNLLLTKYMPAAKSILEKLIYSVKGMMVLNDSAAAFWMGNLVNKNLDGREIPSQTSSEETTFPEMNAISEELINASSEVLDSDIGEDLIEEIESEDDCIDD